MKTKPAHKDWSEYPIGTKAPAIMGGYWIKRKNGWQWNETGGTFPRPGGDNSGIVILPFIDFETLLVLQDRVKEKLYKRPENLQELEDAVCRLCDAIIDYDEYYNTDDL